VSVCTDILVTVVITVIHQFPMIVFSSIQSRVIEMTVFIYFMDIVLLSC